MSEHEKLHKICKQIGYDAWIPLDWVFKDVNWKVDVREIIFTQEFMDAYRKYYIDNFIEWFQIESMYFQLLQNNLDNPVDYLYSLIFQEWNK